MPEEYKGAAPAPLAPVRGTSGGFAVHAEGLRLLVGERRLWALAAIPFAISLLAVSLAIGAIVTYAGTLWALASGVLPFPEAGAWYSWLWVAPLRALAWLAEVLAFVLLAGAAIVLAWLTAGVLAAPFHDALAARVESVVTGRVHDESRPGLRGLVGDAGRSMFEELRRLIFFVGVQALILFLGFVIPGGQLLAAPAMTVFAMLFLPLDYASYTLDRRKIPFRRKRRWVLAHRDAMLGFGAAAFLTFLVPLLNFAAMPVLVVSGTLLALRTPVPD